MGGFNLETCARSNILKLQPYRCARDDYEDNGVNILLDANENAFGPGLDHLPRTNGVTNGKSLPEVDLAGLNRYPDPHQTELKKLICNLRNPRDNPVISPANVFVGVGSDEAIDNLIRTFCEPGKSSLLICPPTYGMYNVSAAINDVNLVKVPLNADFSANVPAILEAFTNDPSIKLAYICSPGNPTAKTIPQEDIEALLAHPTWNGVLVVDEAYIDFAERKPEITSLPPTNSLWDCPSMAPLVVKYPNLVTMATLSKGHGLAGLRLGFVICPEPIANLLNALKAPYNISNPTSEIAIKALSPSSLEIAHGNLQRIVEQRNRLVEELPKVPGIGNIIGGLDSNFLLVEILDGTRDQPGFHLTARRGPASKPAKEAKPSNPHALAVYERLAGSKGVVVRFRGKEHGCEGCLRVTVGTQREVDAFLKEIRIVLADVLGLDGREKAPVGQDAGEEQKEKEESSVIA